MRQRAGRDMRRVDARGLLRADGPAYPPEPQHRRCRGLPLDGLLRRQRARPQPAVPRPVGGRHDAGQVRVAVPAEQLHWRRVWPRVLVRTLAAVQLQDLQPPVSHGVRRRRELPLRWSELLDAVREEWREGSGCTCGQLRLRGMVSSLCYVDMRVQILTAMGAATPTTAATAVPSSTSAAAIR